MPSTPFPPARAVTVLVVGALAVLAIGVAVGYLLFGDAGETTATDPISGPGTPTSEAGDPAGFGGDGHGVGAEGDGEPSAPSVGATTGPEADDGRPEDEQAPPADDPATDGSRDGTGSSGTSTTAARPSPRIATPTSDLPTAAGPLACSLPTSELNGAAGVLPRPESGPCRTLDLAIRAVGGGQLAPTDWTSDLAVCEKHPSATEVAVVVATGTGAVEVLGSELLSDRGGADAIDITLPQGYDPANGVQPIVVCRTSDAELSIVHRTTG